MIAAIRIILLVTSVAISVSGCISTSSYVDPIYKETTYDSIVRLSDPYRIKIIVEFQRNGKHLPKADNELKGHVERVVRASGFFLPTLEGAIGQLKIVVNNHADMGEAAAKGFGTGLTFGLAGSMVTDFYEMKATLSQKDRVITEEKYKHAIHTTVGMKKGLEGQVPMTPSAAFGVVIEQLLLNFIADTQKSDSLFPGVRVRNTTAEASRTENRDLQSTFVRKLSELDTLKSNNQISEEEYDKLRSALFKEYYP
jgi:hypothetical protein